MGRAWSCVHSCFSPGNTRSLPKSLQAFCVSMPQLNWSEYLFMKWMVGIYLCMLLAAYSAAAEQPPDRQVAITIDDLPAGSNTLAVASITEMTTKLLATLRDQKVPVVGFVNEKKLYHPGEVDQRIQALRMWIDSGFELGNHTSAIRPLTRSDWPPGRTMLFRARASPACCSPSAR